MDGVDLNTSFETRKKSIKTKKAKDKTATPKHSKNPVITCTIKGLQHKELRHLKAGKRPFETMEPKRDDYKKINYSEAVTRVKFADNNIG